MKLVCDNGRSDKLDINQGSFAQNLRSLSIPSKLTSSSVPQAMNPKSFPRLTTVDGYDALSIPYTTKAPLKQSENVSVKLCNVDVDTGTSLEEEQGSKQIQRRWGMIAAEQEIHRARGKPPQVQEISNETVLLENEVARLEKETDRILEEQKRLDLERLRASLVTRPPKPKRSLLSLNLSSCLSWSKRPNPYGSEHSKPSRAPQSKFSYVFNENSPNSDVDYPPVPARRVVKKPTSKVSLVELDTSTVASAENNNVSFIESFATW